MLDEAKRRELKEAVKYNPKSVPNPILKAIRTMPYLYSFICRTRRFLSKEISNKEKKRIFEVNSTIFNPNGFEKIHINNLKKDGYTVIENLFNNELIDEIDIKADKLFKELKINDHGYNITHGRIPTLKGFTYEEIETFEQNITLKDPLLNIEKAVEICFNESILKIVSNYLGYAPVSKPLIMRNFPQDEPIEASNFHKDSDSHDVVQVFVYLIDVDGKRGPLTFVPNSHNHDLKSCIPRTNYDLGVDELYGRVSDSEVEKVYPKKDWVTFYGKRATVVIAHVNGFHKGPNWDKFGSNENKYRDTIRINFRGISFEQKNTNEKNKQKIYKKDVAKMSHIQKIFLKNYEILEDGKQL